MGPFETDISNVDTYLFVPVSTVVVFLTTELHLFINHCETTFLLVVNHEEYEINLDILDYFPHFIDCSKIITNTNRVSATECVL